MWLVYGPILYRLQPVKTCDWLDSSHSTLSFCWWELISLQGHQMKTQSQYKCGTKRFWWQRGLSLSPPPWIRVEHMGFRCGSTFFIGRNSWIGIKENQAFLQDWLLGLGRVMRSIVLLKLNVFIPQFFYLDDKNASAITVMAPNVFSFSLQLELCCPSITKSAAVLSDLKLNFWITAQLKL